MHQTDSFEFSFRAFVFTQSPAAIEPSQENHSTLPGLDLGLVVPWRFEPHKGLSVVLAEGCIRYLDVSQVAPGHCHRNALIQVYTWPYMPTISLAGLKTRQHSTRSYFWRTSESLYLTC